MLEVVMLDEDGNDCAIATPDNLIEATDEAITMYRYGHCAVLRQNGVVINRWLGTQWAQPLF